tara:strand:+ start:6058 stop:6342 length:285 start_codon:yes stop_codon:yes gene_type:complete
MVQNPKGGGLSSAFGGGNQIMGARKTSDFLEKTTWILAMTLVTLALLSNFAIPRGVESNQEIIIENIRETDTQNNDDVFDINIEDELEKNDNTN